MNNGVREIFLFVFTRLTSNLKIYFKSWTGTVNGVPPTGGGGGSGYVSNVLSRNVKLDRVKSPVHLYQTNGGHSWACHLFFLPSLWYLFGVLTLHPHCDSAIYLSLTGQVPPSAIKVSWPCIIGVCCNCQLSPYSCKPGLQPWCSMLRDVFQQLQRNATEQWDRSVQL